MDDEQAQNQLVLYPPRPMPNPGVEVNPPRLNLLHMNVPNPPLFHPNPYVPPRVALEVERGTGGIVMYAPTEFHDEVYLKGQSLDLRLVALEKRCESLERVCLEMKQTASRLEALVTQLYYAPTGPGFVEARDDFHKAM